MKINLHQLFKQSPMVLIVIGLIAGILLGNVFNISSITLSIPILIIIFIIIIPRWDRSFLLIVFLSILTGYSLQYHKNSDFQNDLKIFNTLSCEKVEFEGIIYDLNKNSNNQNFILKNIQITSNELKFDSDVKYIVYPKDEYISDVVIGDTLRGSGKIDLFSGIRNPGEFDYRKFYFNKHIIGKIYLDAPIRVFTSNKWFFKKSINKFRSAIKKRLTAYSDSETAALLSALIIGDRTQIDQDLREAFVNVGVVHVLAVSGLHVGYVLIILMILVKIVRIPWGWNKMLIILGLILFSIISGGRPSVIRASLMAGLYTLAPLFNRRPNPWNIIALAAFLILLLNPNALYDLGFQLSFTAVVSIVYFYNLLNKSLPERFRPVNINNNTLRFIWSLFLVSFSAQLGTIPVVALYFGRIPIIAIVANIIVIPLIGLFVALGFMKLLFFWIFPILYFIDQVSWFTKELIYTLISLFNKVPFASLATPQFDLIDLSIYMAILLLVFALIQIKYNKIIIYGLILVNLIIWSKIFTNKSLNVIFLDLGQNESVIIKSSNKNILIDNGVLSMFANDIEHKILQSLKYLEISTIDDFIRPHGNSNQKIGSIKLVETIPINNVWDVAFDESSSFDSYFKSLMESKRINYKNAKRGDVISIDDNTLIQFFLPIEGIDGDNNYLIKIIKGNTSFILFNYLNESNIDVLLENKDPLRANILKMSYPKEISDKFIELLDAINPDKTILTRKRTSKSSPTVQELQKIINNKLFITDSIGAIWLTSDIKNIEVKDWK